MQNSIYKVAGYLRLSREDGDKEESDSIGSQRSIIIRKLENLGQDFELIDFYIDDGYTGLNTDRPAFQKMLEDIKKGLINTIITKDLSRLSRNSFEANYFIEKYFLENNIRYISILDNVDTYIKNSNNDMIGFKTLINDWYSKDISKKELLRNQNLKLKIENDIKKLYNKKIEQSIELEEFKEKYKILKQKEILAKIKFTRRIKNIKFVK